MKALRACRRDVRLTARCGAGDASGGLTRGHGRLTDDIAKDEIVEEEPLLSLII